MRLVGVWLAFGVSLGEIGRAAMRLASVWGPSAGDQSVVISQQLAIALAAKNRAIIARLIMVLLAGISLNGRF